MLGLILLLQAAATLAMVGLIWLLVGVHLWLAEDRRAQLQLAFIVAAVGLMIDSAQLWAGVFSFQQGVFVEWLPPPWMSVLWMQFATTFHYSMNWLSGRYLLCASLGLGGAPLAFFAGERLGAIEFLSPRPLHYGLLALLWSVAVPSLILAADLLARDKSSPATYRIFRRDVSEAHDQDEPSWSRSSPADSDRTNAISGRSGCPARKSDQSDLLPKRRCRQRIPGRSAIRCVTSIAPASRYPTCGNRRRVGLALSRRPKTAVSTASGYASRRPVSPSGDARRGFAATSARNGDPMGAQ